MTCAVLLLALLFTFPGVPAQAGARGAAGEPDYLIFQLSTENRDLEGRVPDVKAEFGALPAGSPRYVGFSVALLTFTMPVEELRRRVTRALDHAEESGLPVSIQLDDVNFMPEYSDASMVEWTAFPKPGETHGPRAKYYWLNWGNWQALPPPPNFESPAIRQEVSKRLKEGVLPPLLERLARWKKQKRSYLFAGIVVGWETGIPEYRPWKNDPTAPRDEQRHITMTPEERGEQLGYASLHARGWTRQKIEARARETGKSVEDVTTGLLYQVIHDYTAFWAKTVNDAGIPKERIYTHGVAWESVPEQRLPAPWFRKSSRVPPVWVYVNPYCRPGYTMGTGQFEPEAFVRLLKAAGVSEGWGGVEAYVRGVDSQAAFGGYLRQLFGNGAHLVDIWGWTATGSPYDPMRAPGALRAIHEWLEGKELPAASPAAQQPPPGMAPDVKLASLQAKMERLHALLAQRQQEGTDMQPVSDLMQGFEPLMQQQKFTEAEALLDRALERVGESAPAKQAPASSDTSLIAYGAADTDGRQQIFVITPDGAGKRRLTQDGKWNYFPAWSPDGKRLAFASNRSGTLQIWVMQAGGGNPTQLTTQGASVAPAWSPDGKRLTFASNRTGRTEIWVMESDGSHQRQLTATPAIEASSKIAELVDIETRMHGVNTPGAAGISNLFPTWSPDGRQIAWCSTQSGDYAIWVMDADGGSPRQLTHPHGSKFPYSNIPAYSPDGSEIVFWSGIDLGPGQIWVMNADGSNRKQLTDQPWPFNCDEPAWSADGSKILFSSNRPGSEGVGTWIMEADGSNQRILLPNTRSRVSWQPGSQAPVGPPKKTSTHIAEPKPVKLGKLPADAAIIFLSTRYDPQRPARPDPGPYHLYVMNLEGGNITQLTFGEPLDYEHAAVSPDRTMIVATRYYRDAEGHSQPTLWVMDLEKQTEVQLVPDFYRAGGGGVDWALDGFIYFAGQPTLRPGRSQDVVLANVAANDLYKIRYDGTGLTQLTNSPQGEVDVSVSEDGAWSTYVNQAARLREPWMEIWMTRTDGKEHKFVYKSGRVGEGSAHDPEQSPDNQWVIFSQVNPDLKNWKEIGWLNTAHDIWVIRTDGTGLRRITPPGGVQIIPDWHDGEILYTEYNEKDHYVGLVTINPDGTGRKRLELGLQNIAHGGRHGKFLPSPLATSEKDPAYLVYQFMADPQRPDEASTWVERLQAEFGRQKPGQSKYVGFGFFIQDMNDDVPSLRRKIETLLGIAEKYEMPVFIQLEGTMFWDRRSDRLFANPEAVEWSAFPAPGQKTGLIVPRIWFNWGDWTAFPVSPPCFESPLFRADVKERLERAVAAPIREALERWRTGGVDRTYLFAGTTVGNEVGIPDYRFTKIQLERNPASRPRDKGKALEMTDAEMVRGGYCSLYNRGYTAERIAEIARARFGGDDAAGKNTEAITTELLDEVVHDYMAFRAKTLADGLVGMGGAQKRIYTHTTSTVRKFMERNMPILAQSIPTVATAVNPYSRPGFTVVRNMLDLPDVVAQMSAAARGTAAFAGRAWGAVESYATAGQPGPPQSQAEYSAYLDKLFTSGAKLVSLLEAPQVASNPFTIAAESPGVKSAIKDWLKK
jgi:Tol biopolymer transport system component